MIAGASDPWKRAALEDRELQGYRKASELFQRYQGGFDRAPSDVLKTLREYNFPVPGIDQMLVSMHGDAAGYRARALQQQLAAQGIQLDDAMIGQQLAPFLQTFAGRDDKEFDAGLKDTLAGIAQAAMARQQQADTIAMQNGQMSQVEFATKYGTPMNALAQHEQTIAAQQRFAQMENQRKAAIDALARRGIPRDQAEELVNLSPNMQTTVMGLDKTAADAAAKQGEEAEQASIGVIDAAIERVKAGATAAKDLAGMAAKNVDTLNEANKATDDTYWIGTSPEKKAAQDAANAAPIDAAARAQQAMKAIEDAPKLVAALETFKTAKKTKKRNFTPQDLQAFREAARAITEQNMTDEEADEWAGAELGL
jgi:hypothetical protein